MRRGRRLAIDFGSARIGLAICDADGILASPLPALSQAVDQTKVVKSIFDTVEENDVLEVIIGDPVSLSGKETASTQLAREFALRIAASIQVPVRLVDERLTTVTASNKLRQAGVSSRNSKALVDSASAVEILEQALAFEKASGNAPGTLVGGDLG